jgi:hypothetical protein
MSPHARRASRALKLACVASGLALGFGASVAHADLFGGDVAVLTQIFRNGLQQLDELRTVSERLGRSYRELQRLSSYAADTKNAFREFQQLDGERILTSGVRAVQRAFPDASYVADDARAGSRGWGRGGGTLGPELSACIESLSRTGRGGGPTAECEHLRRTATGDRVRASLDRTYGTIPRGRTDLAAVRDESVLHERGRLVTEARAALVAEDATDMLRRCKDARDPVVCERIAAEAGVKGYEQQAETNRKLEALIRQQAIANELQAAEQRRGAAEERARRAALLPSVADGGR